MSATTSNRESVNAIIELLENAASSNWTNADPNVFAFYDVAQSERGPGDGQPAELYVWSPTDGDLQAFDAEYSHIDEFRTVEIQVWSLDPTECSEYHQNVIDFLSQYGNDNEANTPFHRIRPDSAADLRSEKPARQTDHYVMTVQVEMRYFRDT